MFDPPRHATSAALASLAMACLVGAACNPAAPTPPGPSASVAPLGSIASGPSATDPGSPDVASSLPSAGQGTTAPTAPDGGTATPEPGPVALRIIETGFTAFSADGNNFASFAAIVENSNVTWAAMRMQVTVEFFDADGVFVAGEQLFVQVLPGQRTALAGEAFGAGRAARMAVTMPEDLTAFEPSSSQGELFIVSALHTTRRDGINITRGRLTSRASVDESPVQLAAVYRNGRGAIIGGAVGGVDSIGPGATLAFEIIDGAPHAVIEGAAAYWQVSGLRR